MTTTTATATNTTTTPPPTTTSSSTPTMFYGSVSKRSLLLADDGSDDDNDSHDTSSGSGRGSTLSLPADYIPGPNDVVCARGKSYWDHEGNQKYRALIGAATEKYSASTNKFEKTTIVSEIVQSVHDRKGQFVKKESKGGPWVVVDEVFAREKVGQSLRDGLHDKYKSSTKSKQQRRACVNQKVHGDMDRLLHANLTVSERMEELSREVQTNGALASDFSIITMFSRANSDILETIKKDASMLNQFQEATAAGSSLEGI